MQKPGHYYHVQGTRLRHSLAELIALWGPWLSREDVMSGVVDEPAGGAGMPVSQDLREVLSRMCSSTAFAEISTGWPPLTITSAKERVGRT